MNVNIENSSKLKPGYVFVLILGVGIIILSIVWVIASQRHYVRIGKLSEFAPSPSPYRVVAGETYVYVVNTGAEIWVINPHYVTARPAWNCDVVWVPANTRYEDPCSGAKFDLRGSWLPSVYVPKEIEPRGLEHYAVQLRNDEIWIDVAFPTPGVLERTATP